MNNERERLATISGQIRDYVEAVDRLREYLTDFDFQSIDECLTQIKTILALHRMGCELSAALDSGISDRFAAAHLELCKASGVVMPAMCGAVTEASIHEAVFVNAYRIIDDLIDRGFDYDIVNLDPMPYGEPSYRAESSFREREVMVRAVAQQAHAIDLDGTVVALRQEHLQAIANLPNSSKQAEVLPVSQAVSLPVSRNTLPKSRVFFGNPVPSPTMQDFAKRYAENMAREKIDIAREIVKEKELTSDPKSLVSQFNTLLSKPGRIRFEPIA